MDLEADALDGVFVMGDSAPLSSILSRCLSIATADKTKSECMPDILRARMQYVIDEMKDCSDMVLYCLLCLCVNNSKCATALIDWNTGNRTRVRDFIAFAAKAFRVMIMHIKLPRERVTVTPVLETGDREAVTTAIGFARAMRMAYISRLPLVLCVCVYVCGRERGGGGAG